ncbi:putative extracellular matrix protein [Cercophora samala]|uniref:Extracellular matrix protein n=1 Tax=Cercophora samala TaxID=330535 RepID=A0AA40DE65_9PEZI|nr:putative extracellular matrix protein [Cercophora samala]
MKYSVAAVFALATAVLAKPRFINSVYDVTVGEPFTLRWDSAEGNVKISLFKGKAGDEKSFKPVEVLTTTTGATGSFTYTPTETLNGDYAFVIEDESGDDNQNFSPPFPLEGTEVVTSVTTSASITTTAETSTETSTESSTETETSTQSNTSTLETSTTSTPSPTRRVQETETAPPNTNNGQRFASSLALVLGTVAALVFFN